MDIFITEYGSQNYSINPILEMYSAILNLLKEAFHIRENYPLEKQELRIYFEYWLDLTSRYIKSNVVFDGDLYIIIDRFDIIFENQITNKMEFQSIFPQFLPPRINLILLVDENSSILDQVSSDQIVRLDSNVKTY